MALGFSLRFPRGRYHATAWGRQVNEGRPEWPPSPWRLARALLAAWHETPGGRADEEDLLDALRLLSSEVRFVLPPTGRGQRRHYYPLDEKPKNGPDVTTLGLDPFVTVAPSAVCRIEFDCAATDEQAALLSELAGRVRYLGRAESLVEMSVDVETAVVMTQDAEVVRPGAPSGLHEDVEQLLQPAAEITLDQLRTTTAELHSSGSLRPQGVRTIRVPYRPAPVEDRVRPRRRMVESRPNTVVLGLTGRPLPSMRDAVLVAEQARVAALKNGRVSAALAGKRDGRRAEGNRHAYWLPLPATIPDLSDEAARGRRDLHAEPITRIVVHSPDGFDRTDVRALLDVARLVPAQTGSGDPFPLEYARSVLGDRTAVGLVAVGDAAELQDAAPLFAAARVWRSLTPVTTRRHRKQRERVEDFLANALRRHLRHVGLPAGEDADVQVEQAGVPRWRTSRNPTRRAKTGGVQTSFHARVTFVSELPGPVLLGALSHFGLGIFVPEGR